MDDDDDSSDRQALRASPSERVRCWLVLERADGGSRQRRVLVNADIGHVRPAMSDVASPAPTSVCIINGTQRMMVACTELEPLTEAENDSLQQLDGLGCSESMLADVIAKLKESGCGLGDINFQRDRNGQISGERKDAVPSPHLGCSKRVVRLGKRCTTPGCEFLDFHDGPCTHELQLEPRRRVRSKSR